MWKDKSDMKLPKSAHFRRNPKTGEDYVRFDDRTPKDYSLGVLMDRHNDEELKLILEALQRSKDPLEQTLGNELAFIWNNGKDGFKSDYILDWYYRDYQGVDQELPFYDEDISHKANVELLLNTVRNQRKASAKNFEDLFKVAA